jgi:hypothetical protein
MDVESVYSLSTLTQGTWLAAAVIDIFILPTSIYIYIFPLSQAPTFFVTPGRKLSLQLLFLLRFRPECPAAAAASKLMCTLLYGARKKPKAAARKEGENLMINLVSYHPWLRIFNFHSSLLLWSKKMRELV